MTQEEITREVPKIERPYVGDDFNAVLKYATVQTPKGPAIDLRKIEELEGRFGYNGGRGCNVRSGPCSCGAWH